jgi:WhiB family redox-sensing transcriptional regulator
MDWRYEAVCTDDAELFFAAETAQAGAARIRLEEEAKAVCARCPVRDACRDWAVEHNQEFGVWGGLNRDERRVLKRKIYQSRARAKREAARSAAEEPCAEGNPANVSVQRGGPVNPLPADA